MLRTCKLTINFTYEDVDPNEMANEMQSHAHNVARALMDHTKAIQVETAIELPVATMKKNPSRLVVPKGVS